jgi:hypothetical protein
MSLVGVFLELTARCPACGRGVPVNALVVNTPCPGCSQQRTITRDRWKTLLENTIAPDAPLGKVQSISTLGDEMKLGAGREDPKCHGCGTAFPDEIAELAARGFAMCGGCGKRTSVRPTPPDFAPHVRGASIVIGEDLAQLAGGATQEAPRASEPVMLNCKNCRAPLSFDGTQRSVRCQYCSVDMYLPDDVWLRLHPVATAQRFYLSWQSPAAVEAAMRKAFKWYSLIDVQIGADGNLYALGVANTLLERDRRVLWCMTPDGVAQWTAYDGDPRSGSDNKGLLAIDPQGRIIVFENKRTLRVFTVAGGAELGKLGGPQPADAHTRVLDAGRLQQIAADVDGTLIVLIGEHLARFAPDGTPLELWPPRGGLFGVKHEKLLPLYDAEGHARSVEDAPSLDKLASYAHTVYSSTRIAVGWDGFYYFAWNRWVVKLDRSGKLVYRVDVQKDVHGRIGADAAGHAYVVTHGNRRRWLMRISSDGKRVDELATDHLHGGVLYHDNDDLCVARDGSTCHVRYGMAMRVLAPDGRLVSISDAARDDDAREQARAKDS